MDFADREKIIRRYLDYVMALESDGNHRVSDMKKIARRAGMSEHEIVEVERAAGAYFELGSVDSRAERLKGRIVFESDSARAANRKRISITTITIRFQAIDSSGTVAFAAPLTTYPCTDLSGSVCFDQTIPYVLGLREVRLEGR
jgi:hypothetical protein